MEQKKHESDMTRKEKAQLRWQTIRSLKGRERLGYLWTYYKSWLFVLAVILVAFSIVVTCIRNVTTRELISMAVIDVQSGAQENADRLEADLLEALGTGKGRERITLDVSAGSGDDYAMGSKRAVIFGSGTTDVVICGSETYETYQEAFKSWEEVLGDQYEMYAGYIEDGRLDLSRSSRWQEYGLTDYEPAYMAVMYDTERDEEIIRLLDFFF